MCACACDELLCGDGSVTVPQRRKSDRLAGLTVGRNEETQMIFVEMALDGRRGDAVVTVSIIYRN